MKSAFEIAMERLEKESGPGRKLSDAQKAEIAEIDRRFDASVAEEKLTFDTKMAKAQSFEEMETLRAELAKALADLETRRERAKEAVWNEA
ncbi:MAG: hypothetical protein AMXMBFR4_22800 [Candidatus Hydrogenedentota bacterium]